MIDVGLAGFFKIEAVSIEDGAEKRRTLANWFPNLVTDNGMDLMGVTAADNLEKCRVGSGNTAPAFTDTGLENEIARSNSVIGSAANIVAGPPRYGWRRVVYRFNEGVAAGNLSEIGVGRDDLGLFSRALIVDALGNPTTITVLANEFLDITYEVRLYIPTGDTAFQIVLDGVTHNVIMRVAENDDTSFWASYIPMANGGANDNWWSATPYTGALSAESLSPSGAIPYHASYIMERPPYTAGSHYITRNMNYTIDAGNGNIKTIVISSAIGKYQFEFTPTIPKTNEKTLSMTFRLHWSRYTL